MLSPTVLIIIAVIVAVAIGAVIFFLWKKIGSGEKEMGLAKDSLAAIRVGMDKHTGMIEKRDEKIVEQGQKIAELEKQLAVMHHQNERLRSKVNIQPPSRRQACDDDSCAIPAPKKQSSTKIMDISDI